MNSDDDCTHVGIEFLCKDLVMHYSHKLKEPKVEAQWQEQSHGRKPELFAYVVSRMRSADFP